MVRILDLVRLEETIELLLLILLLLFVSEKVGAARLNGLPVCPMALGRDLCCLLDNRICGRKTDGAR